MMRVPSFSSLLFVPGNRPDRIDKAFATSAELVCIDLEDAVAPAEKDATRAALIDLLPSLPAARTIVRINGLRTREGLADLLALDGAAALPAWLMIPKLAAPAEAAIAASLLGDRIAGLLGIVETVEGLADSRAIASAPGVAGLMLGIADLSAELGCATDWEPLLAARTVLVAACAAAGITPIDGPSLDLSGGAACAEEARRARALGFVAKAAIHPAQLAAIHANFRPTASDIADAREAVAAFAAAGGQAVRFKGRLLEAPIVRQLERVALFEPKETVNA